MTEYDQKRPNTTSILFKQFHDRKMKSNSERRAIARHYSITIQLFQK